MELKRGALLGFCLLFTVFFQGVPTARGENILFFFGFSSYSHRVPAWPLVEALVEKGHNVTFVSPFLHKSPNPKVHDFVPKKLKAFLESFHDKMHFFDERKKQGRTGNLMIWALLPHLGTMMCEEVYNDEEYLNWVKSTKIDLVVVDALANDCIYGPIHYWGAKFILFGTSSSFTYFTEVYGIPDETNWIPNMEINFPVDMSFSQRVVNALAPVVWHYYRKLTYFPKLEQLTRDKLGITDLPPFEEIERNASLVFLNTHYAEEYARSLPPHTIPIGGIATKIKTKPLPKDLDDFLKKGRAFVYVSFGSQTNFLQMDKSKQQAFIGAMRNFPETQFVWKVDNQSLVHDFPAENVYISKWMPQQEILAHPKIRAFITHAGLLSIQEAIHNAVPLICFPVFAEQDYNAERIHRKEHGIRLEINTIIQPEIEEAISKILTDPKYSNNMKKISMLFKDRPHKPLDTALWWTEYVLRHSKEDLATIRPLSVKLSWWSRRQLDVWAAIAVSTAAFLASLLYLIYRLLRCVCGATASTKLNEKSQKKKLQ